MQTRLSDAALRGLPPAVQTPTYDRSAVRPGIVHLGVGAFHRCHQAVYVDECLAAGDLAWGIIGASLRSPDTRDALTPQDGLYTLAVRDSDGEALRIVGSLLSMIVAPDGPDRLVEALVDPAIKIVTLTVTEKAYLRAAEGGLDRSHPDVTHDLDHPKEPKSVYGFLAEALRRRKASGTVAFTVLCCDNLMANGATLRRLLTEFAGLRDAQLAAFIRDEVAFPSSMVDRIVPATTTADRTRISAVLGLDDAWPVLTEPFTQWVVEDHFPTGRPDWERFGVTMVEDVSPFETMKLRLLNGAHSGIAYLGLLNGNDTVDKAFADPGIRRFVNGLWSEAATTLPQGPDLDTGSYTSRLAVRFANTALAHLTRQIANDGSQKLPQRIVSAAIQRLHEGHSADHLALVPAAWIAASIARGAALPRAHFTDPLDGELPAIFADASPPNMVTAAVFAKAGFARDDACGEELQRLVAAHLDRLLMGGVGPALAYLEEHSR